MFRTSVRLHSRVTFFTRSPCSLCDSAKRVVKNVQAHKGFAYKEIDVMEPGQEKWRSVYEFDTPVIHIDKASATETTTSALKLMHRFSEDDVLEKLAEAERL
ncbi:glutaredoxin 2 [Periconia macrospinosa]|uniref:Glutaredoxin-like protein n=1 Tax=Periconia macrospinosa TaxID=97972 RepID=A0A2V1ECU5_9PLEO|nr:glutaredoxin 2 [Periconia macrospinosa]